MSTTAWGEYAETRTTVIPNSAAAARSTWLNPADRSGRKPNAEAGKVLDHLTVDEVVPEYTYRIRSRRERCRGVVELHFEETEFMGGVGFGEVGLVPRPCGVDSNIYGFEPTLTIGRIV
jgi:hypothetical protein